MKIKILALSGSLRPNSSSHVIIDEIVRSFSSNVEFELYDSIASIPAFDGRDEDPESVNQFKNKIREANGILICTPEYAFGVPGALKNALDWTVGTSEFVKKPVALITASSVGDKGHESLQHTLTAISAVLNPDTTLLIPFIRAKVKEGKIVDAKTKMLVDSLASTFINILQE
jgi:chromate reductase, NAD(P)H dehydrogenase (quinone)